MSDSNQPPEDQGPSTPQPETPAAPPANGAARSEPTPENRPGVPPELLKDLDKTRLPPEERERILAELPPPEERERMCRELMENGGHSFDEILQYIDDLLEQEGIAQP